MSLMSTPAKFQPTSPPLRWDEAGGIRIGSGRVTFAKPYCKATLATLQHGTG